MAISNSHYRELLSQAVANNTSDSEVDDPELIALIAMGQIDELEPTQKNKMLRAIIADPIRSQWLLAVHRDFAIIDTETLKVTSKSNDSDKSHTQDQAKQLKMVHHAPNATKKHSTTRNHFLRIVSTGWAIAACLVITFGLWNMADPQLPSTLDPNSPVITHDTPGSESAGNKLDPNSTSYYIQNNWRNNVLILSTISFSLLTTLLVTCLIAKRNTKSDN